LKLAIEYHFEPFFTDSPKIIDIYIFSYYGSVYMTIIKTAWLRTLAIVMLAGALFPVPYYAYYQLMNWIVMGAALTVAYHAYKARNEAVLWLFVLVAVVFNPVAPLHLRADVWQIADIIAILLFLISFVLLKKKE